MTFAVLGVFDSSRLGVQETLLKMEFIINQVRYHQVSNKSVDKVIYGKKV